MIFETKSKSKQVKNLSHSLFQLFKLEISEIMVESIEKRFDSFQSELRKYALESGHAQVEELTGKMKLWKWKLFHWTNKSGLCKRPCHLFETLRSWASQSMKLQVSTYLHTSITYYLLYVLQRCRYRRYIGFQIFKSGWAGSNEFGIIWPAAHSILPPLYRRLCRRTFRFLNFFPWMSKKMFCYLVLLKVVKWISIHFIYRKLRFWFNCPKFWRFERSFQLWLIFLQFSSNFWNPLVNKKRLMKTVGRLK